jgi:translation initiation factor 4B
VGDVTDFFSDCDCTNVRIIEDKLEMKPKGFGYAEFGTREGLIKALALSGSQFQGRNIRVSVADPRTFYCNYYMCFLRLTILTM